jgi:hypothetical protein
MRIHLLVAALVVITLVASLAQPGVTQGVADDNPVRGKTLRWTFNEAPVAGVVFEHVFREDGTLTWRVLEGPGKGTSKDEARYAARSIADDVYAISYLAASGHTLTVVVNLRTGRIVGFASNEKTWSPLTGTLQR